jgi:Polyketide cyclase / dehydrase and lipid transport
VGREAPYHMRYVLIIAGSLVGLVVLIAIIGALLPRDHVASMTATIPAPPEKVWDAVTNVDSFSSWRGDLQRVDLISRTGGAMSWREHSKHGPVKMAVDVAEPPRRLVVHIADKDLPFGGSWEYIIVPDPAGANHSRLTITERGYVSNPIFRFVSRFVMGHYRSLDAYLRALGKKFGADIIPERV